MQQLVTSFIDAKDLAAFREMLQGLIQQAKPHSVSLNNRDRRGIRTMSTGREGIVRKISTAATEYKDCLPRNEDPAELEAALKYYDDLSGMIVTIQSLLEIFDDTVVGLGVDIMRKADQYVGYLDKARKTEGDLDTVMGEIDDYYQRFTNKDLQKNQP